jgi:thiol-disulfide isomerase/thioredoxin
MKTRTIIIAIAGLVALSAAYAVMADLSAGTKAPIFTLPTLDGKTFTLKQPGKVVMLDIWATWCPPCRAEIPYVIKLSKKYADKDVVIVGVAIDERKSDVSAFVKQKGISYTIALDPGAQTVGSPYQVRGIPATYIIDKTGIIRHVHSGFGGPADAEQIDKEIARLLK